MLQRGGTLTIYFSEGKVPVLKKLEGLKNQKGVSMSEICISALETYLSLIDTTKKSAKK